ncbi:MAG: carbohydrate kinase family protein [Kouleothrix sp.]|nr:carbohydrate kinase family protein [Kouleothrix sp.]
MSAPQADSRPGFDILALGHMTLDLLAWVSRYPVAGDGIVAEQRLWAGGGMAANLAHAVARLGGRVALLCATGDDALAQQAIGELRRAGVNTGYLVQRPDTPAPVTVLMVNPALERAGLVTNLPPHLRLRAAEVPDALIQSARLFFTDLEPADTAIEVAGRARRLGLPVAFDMQMSQQHINLPEYAEQVGQMLALSDYFFANEENFLFWRGRADIHHAIAELVAERPQLTVLVTRGAHGSLIAARAGIITIPAFPTAMVDAIGAGDALHAAFLYTHVILGWQLAAAGRFASAAAALSCMQAGARAALPDMSQVLAFLQSVPAVQ